MHSYSNSKDPLSELAFTAFSSGAIVAEVTTATHSTAVSEYIDTRSTEDSWGTVSSGAAWTWGVRDHYEGAVHYVLVKATLPAAATMTVTANLEDATSTTGAGLANLTTDRSEILGSTESTAAQTVVGRLAYSADFTTAERYVRSSVSLAFSSASTAATNICDYAVPGLALAGGNYSTQYADAPDGSGFDRNTSST